MMRRLRPAWPLSLLTLLLVPVAVRLGTWQLDRADEKRALESGYLASLGGLPIDEETFRHARNPAFRRTHLEGEYAEVQFYVDNHTHRGAPGYWVVTPFRSDRGAVYFVNRGWIGAHGRNELPAAPPPAGGQRIEVVPWPDTGLGPLAGRDDWGAAWPKRVQQLDVERMGRLFDDSVAMQLRLEAGSPGILEPVAATLDLSPARHLGYAVQWFALGAALFATWLVVGWRRVRRVAATP